MMLVVPTEFAKEKWKEIPPTASNYVDVDQTFENLEREPQNLSFKNFEIPQKLPLFTFLLFPLLIFLLLFTSSQSHHI